MSQPNAQPPIDQQVTFLYTRDLPASSRFYEDVLGLPLVLDQGTCRIYRAAGEAFIGVCHCDDAQAPPRDRRGVILTLVTDHVDAWYEHLSARGVSIDQPPTLNEKFGIYHFFLRDPNGYLIEIQRFEDARWPAPRRT